MLIALRPGCALARFVSGWEPNTVAYSDRPLLDSASVGDPTLLRGWCEMQATIRYLAIVSDDPERLARFYTTSFGMQELGRSSAGDVSVTDGFYNLSFLASRPGLGAPGPRQIGIAVDDPDELKDRLQRFAPDLELQPDEGGLHGGEYCLTDPNGYAVSVSTHAFGVPGTPQTLPAMRHVAMCEPRGDAVADFYVNVFGLEKAFTHMWRATGRFLSDGTINLALLGDAE